MPIVRHCDVTLDPAVEGWPAARKGDGVEGGQDDYADKFRRVKTLFARLFSNSS